ncbi:conserved hypothetical protein [Coccidioides posadasii str. Silveira]|uniref:Uncharacterized protein n=1 Tax=Coccidioides posadasii (strain RMSCC 757 / Silveira) TaxID=443226 RepID=E9D808_COCPS|nr:conserved hypothetical protein [Coccidioides posadasii str. Silveira]
MARHKGGLAAGIQQPDCLGLAIPGEAAQTRKFCFFASRDEDGRAGERLLPSIYRPLCAAVSLDIDSNRRRRCSSTRGKVWRENFGRANNSNLSNRGCRRGPTLLSDWPHFASLRKHFVSSAVLTHNVSLSYWPATGNSPEMRVTEIYQPIIVRSCREELSRELSLSGGPTPKYVETLLCYRSYRCGDGKGCRCQAQVDHRWHPPHIAEQGEASPEPKVR